MKVFIAVLLILHGLITIAFSNGSFKAWPPVENPGWLRWWPAVMGQSVLLPQSVAHSAPVALLGGILYLASGIALVAAGLGLLGWIVPQAAWAWLAVAGSAGCLFMLLVYLHPFYLIGLAINLAFLGSILWLHWPSFMSLPS